MTAGLPSEREARGPVAGVGLVHDYLLVMRGAERTFAAIADCWPEAPIYTTLYSSEGTGHRFEGRRVVTSPLQRLGIGQGGFRRLLPLYSWAAERLPVLEHDLVVSSSSAFAHGIRVAPDATHVCYCHTPFRYAWHERERALAETPRALRPLVDRVLERMRRWDLAAAGRVTRFVANSRLTRERIRACYGRDASVVHPPVEVARFVPADPEDYLLVVAELVPHKRIEVALDAARLAHTPARVVGDGPELGRLRRIYDDGARFLGRVPDDELASLYARALALLVANVEEFGIAAVEAQAAGRPVIAAAAGGALETVVDGETGVLVEDPDAHTLADAIRDTDFGGFDPQRIRANAARFAPERFAERLRAEVAAAAGSGAS